MSATPSHAERARTLLASRNEGALATLARDPAGHPYASHLIYALDGAAPIFLISRLAEHTQNLLRDPRASLLVVEAEREGEDSLARGRATLIGTCNPIDEDRDRLEALFCDRHPGARTYARFADFGFWRLSVSMVRYVGGFGRMSFIDAEAFARAEPDPLAPAAHGILVHMNDDHADACLAYARALAAIDGASEAVMIGVDRYGFDLRVTTSEGPRDARLAFPTPVSTPNDVRKTLVEMVRAARAKLA